MKFMPKEPMTIEQACMATCEGYADCKGCPFEKLNNDCKNFCKNNPKEAAKMMGFFPVDDKTVVGCVAIALEETTTRQTLAHKNEKGEYVLNDPPKTTVEEKPLSEWTLQMVKEYCGHTDCIKCRFNRNGGWRGCTFCKQYGGQSSAPVVWELSNKFTQQDIDDAKAVRRIFPQIKFIKKRDDIICQSFTSDTLTLDNSRNRFPSIKVGQTVPINIILADEQNSTDGQK